MACVNNTRPSAHGCGSYYVIPATLYRAWQVVLTVTSPFLVIHDKTTKTPPRQKKKKKKKPVHNKNLQKQEQMQENLQEPTKARAAAREYASTYKSKSGCNNVQVRMQELQERQERLQ